MAAPPLAHTLESGQADTTLISLANSAVGGDAFNAMTPASPTVSPTYSATHVHAGSLAMNINTTATHAETHVDWTGLGSITTSVWFRAYIYLTANPAALIRIMSARTSGAANSGLVRIQTDGTIQAMNAAQTGIGSTSVAVSLNQWVRVEWRIVSSTTVGELEIWLYNTPEAPIASFDSHLTNTAAVLGADTDSCRFGSVTAVGPNAFSYWIDDIAVSSTGQIGPSTAAPQLIRPDADLATTGWATAPLFSKVNEVAADGTVISATSA